jgi:ABC-2 type transport system ATP-binding protein
MHFFAYLKGFLMSVLSVSNLTKIFAAGLWPFSSRPAYKAVDNISFSIQKGEILGLLGPNGAGKTTTIQMLLDTLRPTSGSITYFDKEFASHRVEVLKRVTYASGYDKLPARLTIWENLDIVGRVYGMPAEFRQIRIEEVLRFFNMWHMRNKETGMLSAGQTTKIMLAKAFLPNPEIVLLDEPTASLDPDAAYEVRQFILKQKRERGTSLLITSHNMDEVTEICDRVMVLKQGIIIADSTPEQLAASVANARVHLVITQGKDVLMQYLQTQNIRYALHEHETIIEVDEQKIASFLMKLAQLNVEYAQISIDKPSLEDYFLHIAKR